MLAHRLRRWANINTALGQRVVFAGISSDSHGRWTRVRYSHSLLGAFHDQGL